MFDVAQRLDALRLSAPALRFYALVDGVQYLRHRPQKLPPRFGMCALFDGTPDAVLAHAGPWLVDVEQSEAVMTEDLVDLEHQAPAVSWIISVQDFDGLAQLLRLNLDIELPDGRKALLRFWDPRTLVSLVHIFTPEQREAFFGCFHEWHFLREGQRVWVGRYA